MGPVRGVDNTPDTVTQSIETIAKLRNIPEETLRETVRENFRTLFSL